MVVNTLLKVLEQLLHKIKANRRREIPLIKKGTTHFCNTEDTLDIIPANYIMRVCIIPGGNRIKHHQTIICAN